MVLGLVNWLTALGFKLPHVFCYVSFRMVACAFSTLIMTILFGKGFIASLARLRIGHKMRVGSVAVLADGYKKSEQIPSMGGLLFITTILISALIWIDLTHVFSWILIFTMLWLGLLGAIDDYLKIRGKKEGVLPKVKMLFQLVLGIALSAYLLLPVVTNNAPLKPPKAKVHIEQTTQAMRELSVKEYATHYYIPFIKKPIVVTGVGLLGCFFLSLIVISGTANAVNLTDGLDGLASGLVMLTSVVLAIVAFLSNHIVFASYLNIIYIEGASEIAVFLCAVAGALLGFIWYNAYPAEVFMGDTGSLALGGILGVAAILLRREFLLALIGGVFVIETLSVMIQVLSFRYRGGKRVFLCAPIHHHFQMKGWHESKVVIRFWMLGLLFALLGIASLKFQ